MRAAQEVVPQPAEVRDKEDRRHQAVRPLDWPVLADQPGSELAEAPEEPAARTAGPPVVRAAEALAAQVTEGPAAPPEE